MTRLVDDRQLLDRFRQGERDALGQVYAEYARPLFALLRDGFAFTSGERSMRFAGYSDADELEGGVQEVFVRAFAQRARLAYDGLRPYRNYLFTIARNMVIDGYRQHRRQFVTLEDAEAAGAMTSDGHPATAVAAVSADETIEAQQIQGHVETFIAALEPLERSIFEARFVRGLSVEVSAQELTVSEHRIKATERRLRKRFFNEMRAHGYFDGYGWSGVGVDKLPVWLLLMAGGLS